MVDWILLSESNFALSNSDLKYLNLLFDFILIGWGFVFGACIH